MCIRDSDDVVHALRVQRVEVQAVASVKVGGDGLGVVVDQDGLTAVLLSLIHISPGSHGVTGGVYKARERIHRGMLIHDY